MRGADSFVHLAAVRGQASVARPRDSPRRQRRRHLRPRVPGRPPPAAPVRLRVVAPRRTGPSPTPHHAPFTEDQAAVGRGLTLYSASKLASEALMAAVCGDAGPDYVALRFGTIYGPRVNLDSTNGLLVAVLAALDRGERPPVPWTPRHRPRDDLRCRRGRGRRARARGRAGHPRRGQRRGPARHRRAAVLDPGDALRRRPRATSTGATSAPATSSSARSGCAPCWASRR